MTTLLNAPVITDNYSLYNGDCVETLRQVPDDYLDYSIFSPPFASLFTYSASERDMGNCVSNEQFFQNYQYLADELNRTIKPGRLVSVHCMNLPAFKGRDGYIGIKDFRGDIIRTMQKAGFIYHSEVCIWKNPVVAAVRTKALGLLHKQMVKDSTMSRMGLPDYVCTFRKKGDNPEPVAGEFDHFSGEDGFKSEGNLSIDIWQKYASPVWMDINQTDTLTYREARANDDERHVCPLQLQVIHRCLQLWTNPNDIVLSPFAGIGSEGYESLKLGRRFMGIELKESYFNSMKRNVELALSEKSN